MSNTMRIVAKAGHYRLEQDMAGSFALYKGNGRYIDDKSAIELIREVPELDLRMELVKQWELDNAKLRYAERQSREVL